MVVAAAESRKTDWHVWEVLGGQVLSFHAYDIDLGSYPTLFHSLTLV